MNDRPKLDLTPGERDTLQLALLNLQTRLRRDVMLADQAGATTAAAETRKHIGTLARLAAKLGLEDYL